VRPWTLAAIAALSLAAPSVASAAQIVAGPYPSTYANPSIEIAAGESVTFRNLDVTAPHDVTSTDAGLFSSETVGFPTEVPVVGVEALGPGSYEYICSIHPYMTGTITVAGGGGGGGGDKRPPSLSLSPLDTKLAKVKSARALRLRAKLNEPATVRVSASKAGGGPTLATGRAKLDRGAGTVTAKLTAKGKRAVAKANRLRLAIKAQATDAAGNKGTSKLELTLR
jgi:plastocyanin